jgi:uncharacterized membrane protein YccC
MSAIAKPKLGTLRPPGWFDQFAALLSRELTPTSRKLRTALRMSTIAAIGTGIIAACHVYSEFGAYIVWLLVGAGPMMSVRKATQILIAEGIALAVTVVLARTLVDTPWMMLPLVFVLISFASYLGMVRPLGAGLLLIEVVCLNNFYVVSFAPGDIGWSSAGTFGGSAIAFAVLVIFDNWLWPDPGEAILMKSLGVSVTEARSRFVATSNFYLNPAASPRPPLPPPSTDLPAHMALLDQTAAEGVTEHRHAILLAAITRVARINLEVDRLIFAARENVPRTIREMVRPELEDSLHAIAETLELISQELPVDIQVGVDRPTSPVRARTRTTMDSLSARITQVRPVYIRTASAAEIENFASFTDSLAALTSHVDHFLDEPPPLPAIEKKPLPIFTLHPNPELVRYSFKVGLAAVAGYLIGLYTQRSDLSVILTTVLITALPTYGAALRKMILRIVGAVIGGVISLVAIIIVSPNFESVLAYMLAVFVVFYLSGYASLSSGRVAYAGKQIGTTFTLIFAGLSPSIDIYGPLWRAWGILLGTFVVAIVAFILWPEYAGDSLVPRLRRVILDTLVLTPGGSAVNDDNEIARVNSDAMRVIPEMLQIADDAQLEGRTSAVDHKAVVEAAGTLRRIANRLSYIARGRIVDPLPAMDSPAESDRDAILMAIKRRLQKWLDFFARDDCLKSSAAAEQIAKADSADELRQPLERYSSWIEENNFARISGWTLDQRRTIIAELQSMRRLDFLMGDLDRWLSEIPGTVSSPSMRRQGTS